MNMHLAFQLLRIPKRSAYICLPIDSSSIPKSLKLKITKMSTNSGHSIHTIEYNMTMRMSYLLLYATIWINLTFIMWMIRERHQTVYHSCEISIYKKYKTGEMNPCY